VIDRKSSSGVISNHETRTRVRKRKPKKKGEEKMKKKLISVLLIGAMLTSALVACGSNSASSDSSSAAAGGDSTATGETSVSEPVTIKFWNGFTGSDGDELVELVDKFNSENEYGITVDMDISASLDEQLSSAFAAGEGPELVLFSSASRFTYGDYLQDMSDIFDKTNLDKSDFITSYLDYCSEGDSLYLVPMEIVGFYLYWNKDLFEAAGLDPEKGPSTWDEYVEYAKKITDASSNVYGSGLCYGYNYQMAHTIQRFGGLGVTKGSDGKWQANLAGNKGYAKFLQTYKDLVESGDNPLTDDTDSMMTAGQLGMTINGPWLTGGMETAGINYGITTIPTGDAGEMTSAEVIGMAVTTAADENEKLACYRFIEWWNTKDANGDFPALKWSLDFGYPTYLNSVLNSSEYQANDKVMSMTNTNTNVKADFIVDSSYPGIGSFISDIIPEMTQPVLFDNADPTKVLENLQKKADELVAQYN
jgi:multiple sugar transport system substrate-binding protein